MYRLLFAVVPALLATTVSVPGNATAHPLTDCPSISERGDGLGRLVDTRVGRHDTFDQVTFEFSGSSPSKDPHYRKYGVTPTAEVVTDGRGSHVDVAGSYLYSVKLHYAGGYDTERGEFVYKGPSGFTPEFPALVDVQQVGDFESVISWGIGVKTPVCPVVFELADPPRLVIQFPYA